jgi:hypothetical protein
MTKFYLIIGLFTLVYSSKLIAQDGVFWGHTITFEFEKIEFSHHNDTLLSMDFFVNQKTVSAKCQSLEMEDTKTGHYTLSYSCSSIGGQSQVKTIKCPDIYLKLEFKRSLTKNSVNYITRFITFVFEPTTGPFQKIAVPKMNINNLLENSSSVVIVDAEGKYKVVDGESMENKPVMYHLVKFVKK